MDFIKKLSFQTITNCVVQPILENKVAKASLAVIVLLGSLLAALKYVRLGRKVDWLQQTNTDLQNQVNELNTQVQVIPRAQEILQERETKERGLQDLRDMVGALKTENERLLRENSELKSKKSSTIESNSDTPSSNSRWVRKT